MNSYTPTIEHEKTFKLGETINQTGYFHHIIINIEQEYIRIRTENDNERTRQHVLTVTGKNREGEIKKQTLCVHTATRGPITTDLNIYDCCNTYFSLLLIHNLKYYTVKK